VNVGDLGTKLDAAQTALADALRATGRHTVSTLRLDAERAARLDTATALRQVADARRAALIRGEG
jgi:hypothetical protein